MEEFLKRLQKEKEALQDKIDKIQKRIGIETDSKAKEMLQEQKEIMVAYLDIVNKRLEYHIK
jgi:histidinol phosphatase-like PHP family hydrolase